jgi:hypothetical protein
MWFIADKPWMRYWPQVARYIKDKGICGGLGQKSEGSFPTAQPLTKNPTYVTYPTDPTAQHISKPVPGTAKPTPPAVSAAPAAEQPAGLCGEEQRTANSQQPTANFGEAKEWYDLDEIAQMAGCSRRHADRLLKDPPPGLVKFDHSGIGRPKKLFHMSAHPRLLAEYTLQFRSDPHVVALKHQREIAPDDLAIARLRAQAVEEYRARLGVMSEAAAAIQTVADWSARPRRETIRLDERLARWKRSQTTVIQVGPFCAGTLRNWSSVYKDRLNIIALCPERKGTVGRQREQVPDELLDMIQALATSTARGDVAKAVAKARELWPGDWPENKQGKELSYATILRRLRERDPEKFCDTLGKKGLADFHLKHVPDCSRDYSDLRYNQLWQLDDVTQDFYGHGTDPKSILRPFAYAIIRVSTREWICVVSCECRITQDQVRRLVGLALASPRGGVPEEITFERGTVACDDYLARLLEGLGIKVHRTSMDGGTAAPGMLADKTSGHFQGKAVCESNIKRAFHAEHWDQPSQIGPEARHTEPARNATLLKYAAKCIELGMDPILPTPAEWMELIFQGLERANQKPHSAHPTIVAIVDGQPETRSQTPSERAVSLRQDALKVMDQRLLPLFFERGYAVPVTKNGLKINNGWYGRFDEELQVYAGTRVTVCADPDIPDVVFVQELGRCLELYVAPGYNEPNEQMAQARHIARSKRNQFEQLKARAIEAGAQINLDSVRFTANPVPNRVVEIVANEALLKRAQELATAMTEQQAETAQRARVRKVDVEELLIQRRAGVARGQRPEVGGQPEVPEVGNPRAANVQALEKIEE